MEISHKQLYDYCYGLSSYLINGFIRFGGKKELETGFYFLTQAEQESWNKDLLQKALGCFDCACKVLKDESLIAAYLNACLCCYLLGDKEKFSTFKTQLENLEFPQETVDYILKIWDDPTGFKTIYRYIKCWCTGVKYKNRYERLQEAQTLFETSKKKAIRFVNKMKWEA